jgi:hypothetical protein
LTKYLKGGMKILPFSIIVYHQNIDSEDPEEKIAKN